MLTCRRHPSERAETRQRPLALLDSYLDLILSRR